MATTRSSGTRKTSSSQNKRKTTVRNKKRKTAEQEKIHSEVILILLCAIAIIVFFCNFGLIGVAGNYISYFMFGILGILSYIAPIFAVLCVVFYMSNIGNIVANIKLISAISLFFIISSIFHLFQGNIGEMDTYSISVLYTISGEGKIGGGIIGGSIAYFLYSLLDFFGASLVLIVLTIICVLFITEKSLLSGLKKGSAYVYSNAREEAILRRERVKTRQSEQEKQREIRRLKREEEQAKIDEQKILRMDKKVEGVMVDTSLKLSETMKENLRDDLHEIVLKEEYIRPKEEKKPCISEPKKEIQKEIQNELNVVEQSLANEDVFFYEPLANEEVFSYEPAIEEIKPTELDSVPIKIHQEEVKKTEPIVQRQNIKKIEKIEEVKEVKETENIVLVKHQTNSQKNEYRFPPLSLLHEMKSNSSTESNYALKETALRLQQTLATFGVKVTITDISKGPSVTRYEMQPEQGVKVSKIVGLADDIKLNLAATDIRIEAPIPGKAAVGIEVPNKENTAVSLRGLLETKEFKEYPSNLAFAVGKDIAGKVVVTDIAKMPHMLIAGSTGSGKSVCINTLIMSILYKSHPDDVKLIMIDPKVVELSVYNGIPHLLIPVVTDPKKAAGALHWGVAEMTDRYKKFAELGVRDLKGYNAQVEKNRIPINGECLNKMPQIVIIVDELADLMMVAPGEVEESICRLAQLARAAGIHLIIATQRPSVDVITGLIKANMPSRVAFAVSSGVDSRTILDMNGAEKLLGKGDMLFYPQGYPKPARIQGSFVTDSEVSDIVDFLKNQMIGNVYNEEVEEKMSTLSTSNSSIQGVESERDVLFVEAAKFIIDKDKASIGMLQRIFKIGFNRAARIMDQLADLGIVGEEEGTKPRKILMSMSEFEQLIEEIDI